MQQSKLKLDYLRKKAVISTSLGAARALSVSPYRCFSVVRRSIFHQHPLENQINSL